MMHGVLQSRAALAVGPPRAFAPILRALAAAASPSPQRAPPQILGPWPSSASATRPGPLYPGYSHLRDASWKNERLARCNLSPCALPACTSCSAAREAWPQQWCGRSTHRPACWCGRTSHSTNGHIASSGCCRRRWQRVLHGTPLRRPRDSQSNWQLAQCNLSLCALPACTSCSAAREAHPQCWCAHSSSAPCDHVYTSLPMDDRSASRRPCPRASPGAHTLGAVLITEHYLASVCLFEYRAVGFFTPHCACTARSELKRSSHHDAHGVPKHRYLFISLDRMSEYFIIFNDNIKL